MPALAASVVPTSSSVSTLLHAFRVGPGTYSVFWGPIWGQYQPCSAHMHGHDVLLVACYLLGVSWILSC